MFHLYNASRITYIKSVTDNQVDVYTGRNFQGQDF